MIKTWIIDKFKSVSEHTRLEMCPLTVFAGTNNSGKSTLIQSILLTAQTLQSPVAQRPITLNGHILRLGTFDDIVSSTYKSGPITLGFELSELSLEQVDSTRRTAYRTHRWRTVAEQVESIDCTFKFSASGATERAEILQLQPTLETCSLGVTLRGAGEGSEIAPGQRVEVGKSQLDPKSRVDSLKLEQVTGQELRALEYELSTQPPAPPESFDPYLSKWLAVGASLYHFLPRSLLVRYDMVEEQTKQLVRVFTAPTDYRWGSVELEERDYELIGPEFKRMVIEACAEVVASGAATGAGVAGLYRVQVRKLFDEVVSDFSLATFRNFIQRLNTSNRSVLYQRLAEHTVELEKIVRAGRPPQYLSRFIPLSEHLDTATDYLLEYFRRNVKYLAPLRDEPKPVYPLSGTTDPTDVGFRGEHTAAVLETNRNQIVEYISPQWFEASLAAKPEPTVSTLLNAVHHWLQYMGVVTDVRTFDKGKLGHELKVATGGSQDLRDLTHVGVGVSQVVPIVVLCLLADAGSTLIFEQPELHLHPRVQSRLADFFLSMTMLGKQCIVETHSEHLVNRLRHRVAASLVEDIADRIIIYFVEAIDGKSVYEPIRINRFGSMTKWPKGFFDESEELSAAILRASLTKGR